MRLFSFFRMLPKMASVLSGHTSFIMMAKATEKESSHYCFFLIKMSLTVCFVTEMPQSTLSRLETTGMSGNSVVHFIKALSPTSQTLTHVRPDLHMFCGQLVLVWRSHAPLLHFRGLGKVLMMSQKLAFFKTKIKKTSNCL